MGLATRLTDFGDQRFELVDPTGRHEYCCTGTRQCLGQVVADATGRTRHQGRATCKTEQGGQSCHASLDFLIHDVCFCA